MHRFFHKKEIWILIAVVALAVGWLVLRPKTVGAQARLTFDKGSVYTLSLTQDGVFCYDDGALPVTLQVEAGKVRFIQSVCPDHLCEGFGWISQQGQTAICVPAGAWLEIIP